jgi:hypothetical protein
LIATGHAWTVPKTSCRPEAAASPRESLSASLPCRGLYHIFVRRICAPAATEPSTGLLPVISLIQALLDNCRHLSSMTTGWQLTPTLTSRLRCWATRRTNALKSRSDGFSHKTSAMAQVRGQSFHARSYSFHTYSVKQLFGLIKRKCYIAKSIIFSKNRSVLSLPTQQTGCQDWKRSSSVTSD